MVWNPRLPIPLPDAPARKLPHAARIIAAAATALAAAALLWLLVLRGPHPAPDLSFTYLDGRTVALQSLRGRPVLVSFWATTCPVCRRELPELAALYRELEPRGLEVIGVAMPYDPPNHVLEVSKDERIPFPVALDIEGHAVRAFGGITATPTRFLIDIDGNIVLHRQGTMAIADLRKRILELFPASIPAG